MGLFDTLYSECTGYLDLRAIKEGENTRQDFVPLSDGKAITAWVKQHLKRKANLFFGVATRDGKAGKKENIVNIPAVWVDIDFKLGEQAQIEERLASFPLHPTVRVLSGGGIHAYFVLKEPADNEDIEQCESIMKGLAYSLSGDPASTDATRILRIPNTTNFKYKKPRPVILEHCNGTRYNLSDFDDYVLIPDSSTPLQKHSNQALDAIMTCAFLQHCRDDSVTLPEPQWYAMISELARETGGPALIHAMSKPHKGYKKAATTNKIEHSLNGSDPMTCEKIKTLWNCGKSCGVAAPAALKFELKRRNASNINNADNADKIDNADNGDSCGQRGQMRTTCGQLADNRKQGRDLLSEVRDWIELSSGRFNLRDIYNDLGLRGREQTKACATILSRLVDDKILERYGDVRGNYQIVDKAPPKINFLTCAREYYPLVLPFNLDTLVQIQKKNIIIIAGSSNAGKTAFLLNLLYLNIEYQQGAAVEVPPLKWFCSEMSDQEWNTRLSRSEIALDWWAKGFELFERSDNFHQVIDPNAINIIDYLEVHEDFYRVGGLIKAIFDKLNDGVAIISLQKNQGVELGLGGGRSIEKARLYLSLNNNPPDGQICKIVKLKNRLTEADYNGREMTFSIRNGFICEPTSKWDYPKRRGN